MFHGIPMICSWLFLKHIRLHDITLTTLNFLTGLLHGSQVLQKLIGSWSHTSWSSIITEAKKRKTRTTAHAATVMAEVDYAQTAHKFFSHEIKEETKIPIKTKISGKVCVHEVAFWVKFLTRSSWPFFFLHSCHIWSNLVEVKGHNNDLSWVSRGQNEENLCPQYLKNASLRYTYFCILFNDIEQRIPSAVVGGYQRSAEISRGQTENLVDTKSQEHKFVLISYVVLYFGIWIQEPYHFGAGQRSFKFQCLTVLFCSVQFVSKLLKKKKNLKAVCKWRKYFSRQKM